MQIKNTCISYCYVSLCFFFFFNDSPVAHFGCACASCCARAVFSIRFACCYGNSLFDEIFQNKKFDTQTEHMTMNIYNILTVGYHRRNSWCTFQLCVYFALSSVHVDDVLMHHLLKNCSICINVEMDDHFSFRRFVFLFSVTEEKMVYSRFEFSRWKKRSWVCNLTVELCS